MTFSDNSALDTPFWQFSIDRYARDGVAPGCLGLQQDVDADVNLLLFAFWLGIEGRKLLPLDPGKALLDACAWHDTVVRPIRRIRVQRKKPSDGVVDPVREAIKTLELQAEQIEQALLFAQSAGLATTACADRLGAMIHNARLLIPALGGESHRLALLANRCF